MATMREHSRREWLSDGCVEQIQAGALQRIADATENMAKNYIELERQRNEYRDWWIRECDRTMHLHRRISALKGVITRLQRQLATAHGEEAEDA